MGAVRIVTASKMQVMNDLPLKYYREDVQSL